MHDMASIQKYVDCTQGKKLIQSQFKKHTKTTKNSQKLTLYMKDPREDVKAQVKQSGCKEILISDSALMDHIIYSKIGTEACRAMESAVKTNLCPSVIWVSEEED